MSYITIHGVKRGLLFQSDYRTTSILDQKEKDDPFKLFKHQGSPVLISEVLRLAHTELCAGGLQGSIMHADTSSPKLKCLQHSNTS